MTYEFADQLGPFGRFDRPLSASTVVLTEDENPVDLDFLQTVTASVIRPDGVEVDGIDVNGVASNFSASVVADTIKVTWPTTSVLLDSGVYQLKLRLNDSESVLSPFVVEEQDGWHTLTSARREWPRCPVEDDVQLWELLAIARMQCLSYAEELETNAVPLNFKTAQLVQARNIWNASIADPTGDSSGEFSFQPRPMDWHVKNLLRPRRGFPVVS
jgi:hypothetical protein